jgi:PAS domain-containing protein
MRAVCSYCRKDMGRRPPLDDGGITHVMCPECDAYFAEQWRGMSYEDYVARFPCPVVLVDPDGRVVAMNQSAGEALGRRPREAIGLLGGEAMECAHARLPGGCGKTTHCAACAIRNAVTATHRTGRPQARVPATLRRAGGAVLDLLVSTALEGGVVKVVIEPAAAA